MTVSSWYLAGTVIVCAMWKECWTRWQEKGQTLAESLRRASYYFVNLNLGLQ